MDLATVGIVLVGVAGGVIVGLLGVGGGILFVPALVLILDFSQSDAEGTSLLAILPVALVGAYRQHRYGNLQLRAGILLGVLAAAGVLAGVVLANVLSDRSLSIIFAVFLLVIAAQVLRRALKG